MRTFGLRWKAAYAIMAVAAAVLTGCQGLSTPGSSAALQLAQSSVPFGNVTVGKTKTFTQTITNTTPAAATIMAPGSPAPAPGNITILQITSSSSSYIIEGITLPLVLAPGQSANFTVKFAPKTKGTQSGSITITSDVAEPTTFTLTGTGTDAARLSANHSPLSFGQVQTGTTDVIQETLTNTGGVQTVISSIAASGTGFSVSGVSAPITLQAGQSITFNVRFSPSATGAHSGSFTVRSDASNATLAISASGTGVADGAVTSTPSSVNFGTVQVGVTDTSSATIKNSGGSSVTISSATVSGAQFSIAGLAVPLTLNAGQTATFSVKFKPTATGIVTGQISITSDGSNPTLAIPLSGSGVSDGTLNSNPSSLNFGSVVVGNNQAITETLTNSGGSNLVISAATATGSGFSLSGLALPVTLSAGQSVSFSVKFAPTSAGSASGNIVITSDGTNPTLNIPMSGTGTTPGALGTNPSSLAFGNVQVGNNSAKSETVTNTGSTSVTITGASSSAGAFSVTGLSLPTTLNAGQSATFSVVFAPTAAGSASATLTLTSNAADPTTTVALSGTGTTPGQLAVSPGSQSFGSVTVGSSSSKTSTLSATGSSVQVTAVNSNNPEFTVTGLSLPVTIPAGGSTSFTVKFMPAATGSASGTLTFTSNATNGPTAQSLTGNGAAPVTHRVDLSWTASSTSGVAGYHVYRGSSSAGPYNKLTSSLNLDNTYTDNNVTAGSTYFYVVTAVDDSGAESAYSNPAQANVPTP